MLGVEFYNTPEGRVMIVPANGPTYELCPENSSFIDSFYDIIQEWYPEASAALAEYYKKSAPNVRYYQYLIVHRFIRCNFGTYDNLRDIDEWGRWKFEFVHCPMRGECKLENVCCNPKVSTTLTDIQLRVMGLFYQGRSADEVAEIVFRSPHTVKNIKDRVFAKIGVHSIGEFMRWADQFGLFDSKIKNKREK